MKHMYVLSTRPTPLPTDLTWWSDFNKAIGVPDERAKLCAGVGELIWAMTTCGPDLAFASVKHSQSNSCPHKIHHHGLKHALKYLYHSGGARKVPLWVVFLILNRMTAIDAHERQFCDKLLWGLVTATIFVRC